MTRSTKSQLLAGTSAIAFAAAVSAMSMPSDALAAWSTLAAPTTATQTATNGTALTISSTTNNLDVAAGAAAVNTNQTAAISVTTTAGGDIGIRSTDATANTIAISGTGVSTINLVKGTITGAGTTNLLSTVLVDGTGAAGTITLGATTATDGANSLITNTGGGAAIEMGATNAAQTLTIDNTHGGSITSTTGDAIVALDKATAVITINSNGNITAGTGKYAINMNPDTNTKAVISLTGGTVTGKVDTGTKNTSTIALSGGQVVGTIDGAATVTATTDYTTNGHIGAVHALTKLIINDGVTFNTATNSNTVAATAVQVGSGAAGTAVLKVGTGAITGTIDGDANNKGTLNFTGSNTVGGAIGGTHALGTINITDGTTLAVGANSVSATQINIGTSTAGATMTTGTGTLTGLIDSKAAGTGTLSVIGGATTTLAAGANVGSAFKLAAINVATGGTLVAGTADTINATQVTLTGTGAITLDSGTLTGKIDGAVATNGTVNFTQTNTLNGNIGSAVGVGTVAVSANKTLNANTNNNSITATNLTLAGGSILNLGTGVVTGAIDGTAGALGTVNFTASQTTAGSIGGNNNLLAVNISGGTVTLGAVAGDTIKAQTTTVNTGGTLNFAGTAHTMKGDLTGAGTGVINLGTQTQTISAGDNGTGAGNFTTAVGGETIKIGVRDGTTNHNGNVTIAGAAVIHANTLLYVDTSAATGYIASGKTYKWLTSTGNNNSAVLAGGNVTTNNPLFTVAESVVAGAGGTRTVTLTRVAGGYNGVATTTDSKAAGTVLEALGVAGSTDTQIAAFLGRLDGLGSATAVTNAIKEVTPVVNQSSVQAVSSTSQSLDVVGSRLTQLRAGIDNSASGLAAGGKVADKGIWIQAFGTTATQDLRNGIEGFDADTAGFAVGADKAISDNTRLGLSASYAKSSVDGNGNTISSSDIDSYQLNAYGSYNMGQWYTDGLLGGAFHKFNTDRTIVGTGVANGDYNGETYTARVGGGYRIPTSKGIDVTPNSSLTYSYNHAQGYTETGAGGLNTTVKSADTQALVGRLGADLGYSFNYNSMLVRPVLRAAFLYDFVGDQQSTTAQFTGGGATFKVKDASPARASYNLGASLNVARTDNITFSADYDFQGKSDYTSHSGVLRARYSF